MGPIIILDKSALQSLSAREVMVLHQYYSLNIAPILLVEILGDLKKPKTGSLPKEEVARLATKALPTSSSINVYYRNLLVGSLMGQHVDMRRVPVISGGQQVRDKEGKTGIIFEQSNEEKALDRWRDSDFKKAEELLAGRWREATTTFDLERFLKQLKQHFKQQPSVSDLRSLKKSLDDIFNAKENQTELFTLLITEFNFTMQAAQTIFYRWETEGHPSMSQFAPYAAHCLLVSLFFKLGLVHNLIGTKRTNTVDLEYLYYLPFCMVFCSGDKFHSDLAPLFLQDDQRFVSRDDLKQDLGMIVELTKGKRLDSFTGEGTTSLTADLWRELMAKPLSEQRNLAVGRDGKAGKGLADFLEKKIKGSSPDASGEDISVNEADFVVKNRYIRRTDPCPCGSGTPFDKCCGPKVDEAEQKRRHDTGAER